MPTTTTWLTLYQNSIDMFALEQYDKIVIEMAPDMSANTQVLPTGLQLVTVLTLLKAE